jgi:very-short-patch-repair endonuclease
LADRPLPLAEASPGLERRFIRFCQTRGLPLPAVNVPVGPFTVDCLWRQERLVVELDGWTYHRDRESFEADRRRDAWLQANGHRIMRVTDRRMKEFGDELERELRVLLDVPPAAT